MHRLGHLESCFWRFVSDLVLMGTNERESGSVNHFTIQANCLNKGEWLKLHQGEKILEEILPFSVCIHKAERGSEFSKLISSIWVKQLNLFISGHPPPPTLSLTLCYELLFSYVQSPCFPVLDFSRLLIHSLLGAEGSLPCALTVIMQRLQLHLLSPLMSSCS